MGDLLAIKAWAIKAWAIKACEGDLRPRLQQPQMIAL
jgi:hypothetical protein